MATPTGAGPTGHHDEHHPQQRHPHNQRRHRRALPQRAIQTSHVSTPAPLGKSNVWNWTIAAEVAGWLLFPMPMTAMYLASKMSQSNKQSSGADQKIAFGKKVSSEFKSRVIEIAKNLQVDVNYLMAAMAFESGETFKPDVLNAAGSGAIGLIQFMPSTAKGLGTSTSDLKKMTALKQLDYVEKYFLPYKGKLSTLSDVYMVILWPAAVGKPEDYVLFDKEDKKHPKLYQQNKGLDANKDGKVTKSEAAAAVQQKLTKGLKPENLG